jgi:aspartate carbamoyltransferase catalytic subunit
MWSHKHLLGIEALSPSDVEAVLDRADKCFQLSRQAVKKGASLRGKTVVNLFFETSTRTRTSFEVAGKRLGADVVNVSVSGSSVSKGETLLDTVKNLEAMQPDVLVIRHHVSGAPHFIASRIQCSVVNAGDGAHEHPTQALLDAFTIRRAKKSIDGLVVVVCGDILHSRVARSNALLLGKMGAQVRLCGPKTLMPTHASALGTTVSIHHRLEQALDGADVVMMLRVQNERLVGGGFLSTTREYSRTFGLGPKMLSRAKPDAIVMHPGPINRGVELDHHLADSERSVILDQVEAGVAVRMAILELLAA